MWNETAELRTGSITDNTIAWPGWDAVIRVLSLQDYNTRVVVIGTTLLGIAAGVVGTFAYLRKRAMMGDALSHATLPGIALMFIIMGEKSLPALLVGAAISGVLGIFSVMGLRRFSRLKEDASIGIVLSVYFGLGMALVGFVQQMKTGNEAGLSTFIYGKAAAMLARDQWLIFATACGSLLMTALLFKEFRVVCFDPQFAAAQGIRVGLIDLYMMGLVVLTTVVGLQAVGLILVVAMLIIPAAAARFWTDELLVMTILAGLFGAISGWFGSSFSALLPRMPTGAVIVLCAGVVFAISMLFAPRRGVIAAFVRRTTLARKIAYQNLLRELAEHEEYRGEGAGISVDDLMQTRSWTRRELGKLISTARRRVNVWIDRLGHVRLTREGRADARRILRNHRLWEMYLIKYADVAPSHVDRDADEVEHVLSMDIIQSLERAVQETRAIPPSPHPGAKPA